MVIGAPVLEVDGLGFDIGPRRLWDELSLSVRPGNAVAVLGPSGRGRRRCSAVSAGCRPRREGLSGCGARTCTGVFVARGG